MFIPAAIFFGLFLYEREMKDCVWLDFVLKKLGSCLQSFCQCRNESCGGGGWHDCIAFHEAVAQFWLHSFSWGSCSVTCRSFFWLIYTNLQFSYKMILFCIRSCWFKTPPQKAEENFWLKNGKLCLFVIIFFWIHFSSFSCFNILIVPSMERSMKIH